VSYKLISSNPSVPSQIALSSASPLTFGSDFTSASTDAVQTQDLNESDVGNVPVANPGQGGEIPHVLHPLPGHSGKTPAAYKMKVPLRPLPKPHDPVDDDEPDEPQEDVPAEDDVPFEDDFLVEESESELVYDEEEEEPVGVDFFGYESEHVPVEEDNAEVDVVQSDNESELAAELENEASDAQAGIYSHVGESSKVKVGRHHGRKLMQDEVMEKDEEEDYGVREEGEDGDGFEEDEDEALGEEEYDEEGEQDEQVMSFDDEDDVDDMAEESDEEEEGEEEYEEDDALDDDGGVYEESIEEEEEEQEDEEGGMFADAADAYEQGNETLDDNDDDVVVDVEEDQE
jgi:hypothetical protein